MSDPVEQAAETVGEFVEKVKEASPGSIHRYGYRFTYIGEIQLDAPPDGFFPFPDAVGGWTGEQQESSDE